ncbi:hypothetical protein [Kibdelosporangium phytohabitans]|uniref:Uncharacterized protein n=1 Tax=Kibdelosporangium phytohabitans TaxID=860235 RepID=A0A0N9IFK2_9PSEU|nr:hypothetical protein [Kibdelosporangium phytohabitans]ALG15280.1 hypothetical protein AOZ06_34630 [Kibdelosporangium phytohabitans]MBE1462637.1 hypothetical protein [Kibdelosporangium phytohabitans]
MNTVVQLNGHSLRVRLAQEDRAEDTGRVAADDRLTCHVHSRWIHQCVSSCAHVNQVTWHRWCRSCRTELTVAVDELTGAVRISCPCCGDGGSAATRRLERACAASLAYSRAHAAQPAQVVSGQAS